MTLQIPLQRAYRSEMAMNHRKKPLEKLEHGSSDDEEEGDTTSQVKYFSNFISQEGGHIKKWYSM